MAGLDKTTPTPTQIVVLTQSRVLELGLNIDLRDQGSKSCTQDDPCMGLMIPGLADQNTSLLDFVV